MESHTFLCGDFMLKLVWRLYDNLIPSGRNGRKRRVGPKNCLRIFKLSKSVNGKESIPAIHPSPKAPVTWPHPIEPRRGRVGKARPARRPKQAKTERQEASTPFANH